MNRPYEGGVSIFPLSREPSYFSRHSPLLLARKRKKWGLSPTPTKHESFCRRREASLSLTRFITGEKYFPPLFSQLTYLVSRETSKESFFRKRQAKFPIFGLGQKEGSFSSSLFALTFLLSPGTLHGLSPKRGKNEVWAQLLRNMRVSIGGGKTHSSRNRLLYFRANFLHASPVLLFRAILAAVEVS